MWYLTITASEFWRVKRKATAYFKIQIVTEIRFKLQPLTQKSSSKSAEVITTYDKFECRDTNQHVEDEWCHKTLVDYVCQRLSPHVRPVQHTSSVTHVSTSYVSWSPWLGKLSILVYRLLFTVGLTTATLCCWSGQSLPTETLVCAENGCSYGVWSGPKWTHHTSSWRSTLATC